MSIVSSYTIDSVTDPHKVVVDNVNSQLIYIGRSGDSAAATSSATWQIQRIYKIGAITTRDYAGGGAYNQIWDNRSSLFPTPSFFNLLSTDFNGTSAYVNMGNAHLYDVADQFTLSFWVYLDNVATQRCIYSKTTNDANVYGLSIQVTTAGKVFLQVRAPGFLTSHTGSATVPIQTWVNITVTYTGAANISGFRIYIDGVVDSTPASAAIGASILTGQNAILGARGGAGFFMSGFIDEVTMWGIGFNSAEVTALYNSGSPINPTNHSQAARLDSWYRMGDDDAYPTIADNAGAFDGTMTNMTAADFVNDVP